MNALRGTYLAGIGIGMVALAGCRLLQPHPVLAGSRIAPGPAPDPAPIQADVQALQEWRQEVRLGQEQQDRDLEALRTRVQALETAFREQQQAMKAQIQDLEVVRERDKRFVVEELSRKVADLQKALTPPPAPAAPVRGSGYEHVVKSGETLSEIARAYKANVAAILKANDIRDANTIRVGQKLFIPD